MSRFLVALCAALVLLCGCVGSASAAPYFGFNDNAVRLGQVTAAQDALLSSQVGATAMRTTFDWRWAQKVKNGPVDWTTYDGMYAEMLAKGIKPIWTVLFAPNWAHTGGCDQWATDCRLPPTPDHYDAWRSIVAQLTQRYPQSAGIEIWNEQNLREYWQSGANAADYTAILKEAYGAIKAVDPAMPVVSGGVNSVDADGNGNVSMANFLRGMYAAGAKSAMDGLGFHDYPKSIETDANSKFAQIVNTVRSVRDANNDSARPLWLTEVGIYTGNETSENQQENLNIGAWRALKSASDVRAVIVHTLLDAGANDSYGVMRTDLTPKTAYCAIAAEMGTAFACPVPFLTYGGLVSADTDARNALDAALVVAKKWYTDHRTYTGLTTSYLHQQSAALSATPPVEPQAPGLTADPSRVAVSVYAGGTQVGLRNASRGNYAYAILRTGTGQPLYASATNSTYGAAAAAAGSGARTTW